MLWKKTIVMLAAFAALTGLALAARVVPSSGTGPTLDLPAFTADQVEKIGNRQGGENIVLERAGDGWTMQPGGKPAASKKIERALEAVTGLSAGRWSPSWRTGIKPTKWTIKPRA
ncbi:MAG: DUF4340 domain-containing protein [Deltaproteobacteria bacterium]|nr:DUF4340 domain-containing protein [Deltaproteobacteria bacterium]